MEKSTFIEQHRPLFWSVSDAQLAHLSDALLVETILNYGSLDDVRGLFEVLGLRETARVFRQTADGGGSGAA